MSDDTQRVDVGTEEGRRYELLVPAELRRLQEECPLVLVPIGPLEYHGPHLPLTTDPLNAYRVCIDACVGIQKGVVHPPLYFGTDAYLDDGTKTKMGLPVDTTIIGMDYPAALWKSHYTSPWLLALIIEDTIKHLVANGYRSIVVVNGHGAQMQHQILDDVCRRARYEHRVSVEWNMTELDLSAEERGGHADLYETSLIVSYEEDHFHRSLVALDQLPEIDVPLSYAESSVVDERGWGDESYHDVSRDAHPRRATKEKGDRLHALAVGKVVELIEKSLSDPSSKGSKE